MARQLMTVSPHDGVNGNSHKNDDGVDADYIAYENVSLSRESESFKSLEPLVQSQLQLQNEVGATCPAWRRENPLFARKDRQDQFHPYDAPHMKRQDILT